MSRSARYNNIMPQLVDDSIDDREDSSISKTLPSDGKLQHTMGDSDAMSDSFERMDLHRRQESIHSHISVARHLFARESTSNNIDHANEVGQEQESVSTAFRRYQSYEQYRTKSRQVLDQGTLPTIHWVMQFERTQRRLNQQYLDRTAGHIFNVLLAGNTDILQHHTQGDFVAALEQDATLMQLVRDMHDRAMNGQPCVYRLTIADADGHGHSLEELNEVLATMRQYAGRRLARYHLSAIDHCSEDGIVHQRDGHPIGRWISDRDGEVLESRIEVITQFIANASRRPSAFNQPFTYTGSMTDYVQRIRSHTRGDSQYLLQLFFSISKYLFPRLELHTHPLFLCFEVGQLGPAELLFERLGGSMVSTGGGFAINPAGTLNPSRGAFANESWAEWTKEALENTPYCERLAKLEQHEEWLAAKDSFRRKQRRRDHIRALVKAFGEETSTGVTDR